MIFYNYRYSIKNIELSTDYTYVFRDGDITYLNIIHDYENRRLPVIQAGIEMNRENLYNVYKYKNIALLKFDVYEERVDDEDNILGTELYLRHTFSIIPMYAQSKYITAVDDTSNKYVDDMASLQTFEMYLIDMTAVNWFTKQISAIYQNASVAAVMHALMLSRNIPSRTVIATPPALDKVHDYIIVPLGDLITNIKDLNITYGIYRAAPTVYYDLDYLYCINRIDPNIELKLYANYENVTFVLKNATSSEINVTGTCIDSSARTNYVNLQSAPVIEDTTIKDTSTKFATITTVDSSGKVAKSTIDDKATALAYQYAYNDLTSDQITNEIMNGHRLAVTTKNCSIESFTPIKNYYFNVDSEYTNLNLTGHVYRIASWSVNISRRSNRVYTHDVNLVLYNPTRNK